MTVASWTSGNSSSHTSSTLSSLDALFDGDICKLGTDDAGELRLLRDGVGDGMAIRTVISTFSGAVSSMGKGEGAVFVSSEEGNVVVETSFGLVASKTSSTLVCVSSGGMWYVTDTGYICISQCHPTSLGRVGSVH